MQISEESIDKYIELCVEEHGVQIDRAKARDELTSLACLLEAVYQFNNKENYE